MFVHAYELFPEAVPHAQRPLYTLLQNVWGQMYVAQKHYIIQDKHRSF